MASAGHLEILVSELTSWKNGSSCKGRKDLFLMPVPQECPAMSLIGQGPGGLSEHLMFFRGPPLLSVSLPHFSMVT